MQHNILHSYYFIDHVPPTHTQYALYATETTLQTTFFSAFRPPPAKKKKLKNADAV